MRRFGAFFAVIVLMLLAQSGYGDRPTQGIGTHAMGRLRTIGFETQALGGNNALLTFEGQTSGSNAPTIDMTFFRSGGASLKCTRTSAAGSHNLIALTTAETPAVGTTVFLRAYMYFDNLPVSTTRIMYIQSTTTAGLLVDVRLTATGALQLFNFPAASQIGSDSAPIVTGVWYRIELSYTSSSTAGTQAAELRLDGATLASGTNLSVAANAVTDQFNYGWTNDPGAAGLVCHVDDVAVNSSSGASQNSWPGEGSIVMLRPISDNARVGWLAGAGGTTSLFDALNNLPPVGVADASETNTSQIKDAVSSATDNYSANLQDYATGGVPLTATITLVQPLVANGQASTASTLAGAVTVVSNPAQAVETSFTYGLQQQLTGIQLAVAAGTWPAGWPGAWGVATVGDIAAANRATSPVLRIGKRTSSTREVNAAFAGLMVEYVPGFPVSALHPFMDGPATNTLLRM